MSNKALKMNPDIAKERVNPQIDIEEMKKFMGVWLYGSEENHKELNEIS